MEKPELSSDAYTNEELSASGEEQDIGQFGYKSELKVHQCFVS